MRTIIFRVCAILVVGLVILSSWANGLILVQAGPSEPPESAAASQATVRLIEPLQAVPLDAQAIYLVRLRDRPLASYRGGIAGLEATNPAARGERKLDAKSAASLAYQDYLLARQAEFLAKLESSLGRVVQVKFRYYAATNGLALFLTAAEASEARQMPEVAFVQRNYLRYLETDATPQWIGAPGLWDGSNTGGLPGTKGEGIIIGVIDSGINPSNPSFADVGGDGYDHTNKWGAGVYVGVCDPLNPGYNAAFHCNDKLIGAWDFATTAGNDALDGTGHGSHTASTAGGNVTTAHLIGNTITVDRQISGIAPHANLVMYRACLSESCSMDALVKAIDQVTIDGVDVVNYSIGSAAPSDAWNDADTLSFLNARDAGIFVSTSAGNRGPSPATTGNPGDAPWLMSNGAATANRKVTNALINLTGGTTPPPADLVGVSFTSGYGPAQIVYAGNYGDALCLNPFTAGTFSGQIVICDRGTNARVDKGSNVKAGGAGGFVLANTVNEGDALVSDDHYLPAVHITYTDGVKLKTWVADGGASHQGTIRGTLFETNTAWADILANFSSRGPDRAIPDMIKPNISGPGKDVLAAVGIGDPSPPEWTFYEGTSMASPHGAGSGALLTALHPTWTPDEIQSALQMTAIQSMQDYDLGAPPTPFDMGSGRVDLTRASKTGLVMNETRAKYDAANPATGGDPSTLNLPSLGKGACYQTCAWSRTFRSTQGASVTWTVSAAVDPTAGTGLNLTVSPASFGIPGGGTQAVTINADVRRATPDTWVFGMVTLTPSDTNLPTLHLPVAAYANGSNDAARLEKTASLSQVSLNSNLHYTVNLTHKSMASKTYALTDPFPANAAYVAGSATTPSGFSLTVGADKLTWNGTVAASPFVISEETRSGYISMGGLGVPPIDLSSLNKDTGCFSLSGLNLVWFGSTYTEVIVSLNGTLQADTFPPFCAGETNGQVPSTSYPNNLLAPWWDDLNFTGGGNIYAVLVDYNGATHTVLSWENAPVDGTANTATFQIWIEDGTDNIWFAYPSGGLPTGAPTATVGAENSGGTLGAQYYYNGTGKIPDGTVDLVVGPQAVVKTFGFDVTATALPELLNQAQMTEGSTSAVAYDYSVVTVLNTWLGTTTGWQTASNWSRNAVPGASDVVVIPSHPTGGSMPVLSGNASAFSVDLQAGASLNLNGFKLTVEDALNNLGQLIQTYSSLPNGATSRLLEITNASAAQTKYFGMEIRPTSGSMGSTTVKINGGAQCTTQDPTDTVNRCYEILPGSPAAADVRFYYLISELDGQAQANLLAWHWSGSNWTAAGTLQGRGTLYPAYGWVEATGVTSYSPFALTDKVSGPTDVGLERFKAYFASSWLLPVLVGGVIGIVLLGALGRRILLNPKAQRRKGA